MISLISPKGFSTHRRNGRYGIFTSTFTRNRSLRRGESRSARNTFPTNGETSISTCAQAQDETGMTDDGQKALKELVSKYNKVCDEVIRAKMDELSSNPTRRKEETQTHN